MKKIEANQIPDMKTTEEISSEIIEICKEQGENENNIAIKLYAMTLMAKW